MTERKLKKSVVYGLYALAFISIIGTIYIFELSTSRNFDDDTTYVNDTILEDNIPVVNVKNQIIRPYDANNVGVVKSFYDYKADSGNQQDSLIYYEDTYLQNSGVDYSAAGENFNVLSILDGVVINVTENTLLGKTVEIKHDNGLISVYQSLSEFTVSINEEVVQGQVIGTSGVANIDTSLGNHLHFELIHDGINVNPENYYDKKISEI